MMPASVQCHRGGGWWVGYATYSAFFAECLVRCALEALLALRFPAWLQRCSC
jgi:hypothetical protein